MQKGFDYKFHTLDSGLRLITIPMRSTKTATVLVLVGTGSKYETKDINGISHFLEHMMFKGTTKRPGKLDIARELDGIGADYNAFTGKEYTGYYAKASASRIDTLMDVIFDIFLNSKLNEEAIQVEKGVIVEEINMNRDIPQRYVSDLFEQLLYGDQPAGWDIAGEKKTIIKLKRDNFVQYFNSHYVAQNTLIAVAGNIESEHIKQKIEEYFSHIRQHEPFKKLKVIERQDSPQTLIFKKKTDQTHFHLGFRGYDMFDKRKYATGILSTVLGGSMSSRLFFEVREKRGLAYHIRTGIQAYTDSGSFIVTADVNNKRTPEAISVILEEIRKVVKEGITKDELQKAKDQIEGKTVLGLELSDAVAAAYAEPILFENKVLTPEEELGKIKEVELEQVHDAAQDIFRNEKLNLALIGPFKDEKLFKEILRV